MNRRHCTSTLMAPFRGEEAEHQCTGNDRHEGNHYCGCGYEWNNAQVIVTDAGALIREKR